MDCDPGAPWIKVFHAAAEDDKFWDKEIRRPATAFLARGIRAAPSLPAPAAEALANIDAAAHGAGARGAGAPIKRPPPPGEG
eukprot:12668752-Alexandrium_andersonii.AAC.1